MQKFILYTIDNAVFMGNLWKYDQEKNHYVNLTLEKFVEINKEYNQYMQEKLKKMENSRQQKEEVKKIAEKEFSNIVKQSDVKFETKNP